MKWYVASRTRHRDSLISVSEHLKQCGHTIMSTWVYLDTIVPYTEHLEKVQGVAGDVVRSISNTDVFVLISDPDGTDMFVELGVALAKHAQNPSSIRIYIIGEHGTRSLMQLHPGVIHLPTLNDVLEKEGVLVVDFEIPPMV